MTAQSWGRWPPSRAAQEVPLADRSAPLPAAQGAGLLAHGLGRSYGDVALNDSGTLLLTRGLDRYIAFDRQTGVLRAEAGVSLDDILQLVVPAGWFPAVVPGTRFVTLGGAVANDVHGKNHHSAGSFGCHVRALELLRSDGDRLVCTPDHNADWLAATIGGLGLTGLITWVELQLAALPSAHLEVINRKFATLDGYWALDAELGPRHSHAVAWIDCLAGGRGIYSAADFSAGDDAGGDFGGGYSGDDGPAARGAGSAPQRPTGDPSAPPARLPAQRRRNMPIDPPVSLVNRLSLRAFNAAYYRRPVPARGLQHYERFLFPLDGIANWNRIYGRRGFFQYQCVLPPATMRAATSALLQRIGRSAQGSFLAVLKTFGDRRSPGMMSFARPGSTLALDFPNLGERTLALLRELDAVVTDAGGALYPAKDARMPPTLFRSGYPQLDAFSAYVDPAFSSSLWRRVTDGGRP